MDTKLYLIENHGCDDTTYGLFELTQIEYNFLKNIFDKLNENSSYGCQPKIYFNLDAHDIREVIGFDDVYDYEETSNDYSAIVKRINGKIYRWEE